jgi:hypothetical protein
MVLVDTSIWINYFRDPAAEGNGLLEELVREHNRAAICGIIIQEILQGIRDEKSYRLTRQRLLFLPFLEATRDVHLIAAALYRDLRKTGVTVPSTDAAIAAVAIHNGFPLFTADTHFTDIARNSDLKLFT